VAFDYNWDRWMDRAWPWMVFGIGLAILLSVRYMVIRWAAGRARSTQYGLAAVEAFRAPTVLWALAGAALIALRYAGLTERQQQLADMWVRVFIIASLSLVGAALAVRLAQLYGERRGLPIAVAGLSRTLIYILVFTMGGMTLLRELNITITPILTALGVGGLAVALALQDTLANFFAGIHILIEEPLSLGDFVRLSSGEEGTVTDIGWRTTRLKTPAASVVVVPNKQITSSILTNFNVPETRTPVEVSIVAGHDASLDALRRIVVEETGAAEGVLKDFAPVFLCDPGITPTHLQVKVVFQIANRLTTGAVQSAVRTRINNRLRVENVPLPSPDRNWSRS
jgi:small-conductance mechanosensitive channel